MIDELLTPASMFREDNRAASELIGYVIVFSVIISTVVFVSLSAAPIVNDTQSRESARAMEKSFLKIDDSLTTVQEGASNQITKVQVPAGQLRQLNATKIEFNQNGKTMTIETRPMQYTTTNGRTVVYNGRFIASSPNGDADPNTHIRHMPPETHMDRNPIVMIPNVTDSTGASAYSSSRASDVVFEINQTNRDTQANSEVFIQDDGNVVDVTVTTEIPSAWEAYLDQHQAFTVTGVSGNTVNAEVDLTALEGDRLTVTSHTIEIVFGGQ